MDRDEMILNIIIREDLAKYKGRKVNDLTSEEVFDCMKIKGIEPRKLAIKDEEDPRIVRIRQMQLGIRLRDQFELIIQDIRAEDALCRAKLRDKEADVAQAFAFTMYDEAEKKANNAKFLKGKLRALKNILKDPTVTDYSEEYAQHLVLQIEDDIEQAIAGAEKTLADAKQACHNAKNVRADVSKLLDEAWSARLDALEAAGLIPVRPA